MESQQRQQFRKYLDILVRRKALILTCMLIGAVSGLTVYLKTPKVYKSTVLLSYQQQNVSPNKMAPDSEARITDIVSTLSQIVTSRTSLEQIIDDLGLYENQKRNLPMEDVIEGMRKKIEIVPSNRGDTFQVSFVGGEPRQVVRAANTIAARFIEENLKYREERASETSAYTQSELELAKEMLDRKEAIMRDYKLRYYNEMPDQRASNVARLIALQEQNQNRQESIQDLERTRALIQDQISGRRQILLENEQLRRAARNNAALAASTENEPDQLSRLQVLLESLQAKYTDRHPDIKRLKKEIARLEQDASSQTKGGKGTGDETVRKQLDETILDLQIQLKDVALSIQNLNEEKLQLQERIEQYEKWVEAAPVREAEWSALTREYGEFKRHYDFLVSQNLQATSVLNLERKQKGSQFKIEDPARVPVKPFQPDFMRVLGFALALGSGIGAALALALELMDTSFRDPDELQSAVNLEIICSIPSVALEREVRKDRLMTILGSLALLIGVSGIGAAFLYFWKQGQIIF